MSFVAVGEAAALEDGIDDRKQTKAMTKKGSATEHLGKAKLFDEKQGTVIWKLARDSTAINRKKTLPQR